MGGDDEIVFARLDLQIAHRDAGKVAPFELRKASAAIERNEKAELGADVNSRDHNGYNPVHHAAARGDNELIQYLVSKGADVMAVSRRGQTTADMANGPVQRIPPFLETVALLEKMGSKNNHKCKSC